MARDPRRSPPGFGRARPRRGAARPDALSATAADLRAALADTDVALKARLLDQRRLAGIGNLIADEVLWRASLAPARPCRSLSAGDLRRLHRHLHTGLIELIERGGDPTWATCSRNAIPAAVARDQTELSRGVVGGRTTWWCPRHQR